MPLGVMARTVSEIMNRELFGVPQDARIADVLEAILAYGITTVPVLDDARRPVGVTSLRDLLRDDKEPRITAPAVTIAPAATLAHAAEVMDESGHHHLVVVDADGRAVGMVSSLDLVRALVGRPVKRPPTFPHRDRRFGIVWSDDQVLDAAHAELAPDAPGVLALVRGAAGREEVIVWIEDVRSVGARARELAAVPQDELALARILDHGDVRFRWSVVLDAEERASIARVLRDAVSAQRLPVPAALEATTNGASGTRERRVP